MNLPPSVSALARLIRRDLREIKEAVQQETRADHEAGEAATKQQEVVISTATDKKLVAEVYPNDPKGQATQTSMKRATWVAACGAWAAFIAATIYAGIAAGQLRSMNATYEQIKQQTTINRQQLIGSQAAVLDMGIAFNDGSGEFNVELTNSGHVTATEIHLKVEASKQKLKDGTLIGQAYKFEPTIPPIQGQKGGPNWIWKSPYGMTEQERQMPGGRWPPGWPGDKTYVFRVTLSYQNGFGEESKEEVCQQTLPAWSIVWSKDRMSSGGGLYECRDINATIDSIVEQHRKEEQAAAKAN